MKIKVNNKETELTQGNNVASLAQQGDSLVIIKAACGG